MEWRADVVGRLPHLGNFRLRCGVKGNEAIMSAEVPILEARELTKRYSAVMAVRDISLSIGRGETLGVLGPNGAGKSTIVKMVTGLLEPSRGAVLFHGEPISRDLAAFKRRLG